MASPQDYADFGSFAWAMSDPEVNAVLTQAHAENWPPDKVTAALQATGWWRTQEDSVRGWNQLIAADPQEALDRRDTQFRNIKSLAQQLGVDVPDDVALSWADSSLRYSWTPQQLTDTMLTTWTYHPESPAFGKSSTVIQDVNDLVSQYAVPISDATKNDWIHQVLQGAVTVDEFKGYLSNMAKSRFPGLSDALDRGITVRQYADPYVQLAAQQLEVDPSTISLDDPKWQKFLDFRDPKTGESGQMTMSEWMKTLRTDPTYGFDTTTNAKTLAAQGAQTLLSKFGAVA